MEIVIRDDQNKVEISDILMQKIKRILENVLERYNKKSFEVCVVFVDDNFIRDLNKKYRGKDQATDVLSFTMQGAEDEQGFFDETEDILGDIIISAETAARQCGGYGHAFEKEISYLAVHGVLHLLGYDHDTEKEKKEMRSLEKEILGFFNTETGND